MTVSSIDATLGRAGGLDRARVLFPGVLACGVVSAASTFLSQHLSTHDLAAMASISTTNLRDKHS
jgi:hypothetical protein